MKIKLPRPPKPPKLPKIKKIKLPKVKLSPGPLVSRDRSGW